MKTRLAVGVSLLVVVLALANLLLGHAQDAASKPAQPAAGSGAAPLSNPLKVALLKWYQANTVPTTFPVGAGPYGMAFDGANIWVACGGGATKLRASDGQVLGTFATNGSAGVTFDGANIWVSSGLASVGSVTKLR